MYCGEDYECFILRSEPLLDLDGFRAFITSYLGTDTPEELIRHLFFSFVKKKRDHSQQQEKETAGPSSETVSKYEAPLADPKADDSGFLAPGTSQEHYKVSLEEMAERLQSLKHDDSSGETSDTENTWKEACRALMSSGRSLSCHGSQEGTSIEMTNRSATLPFLFPNTQGGSAPAPTSEEKEGVGETSLAKAEAVHPGAQLVSRRDKASSSPPAEGRNPGAQLVSRKDMASSSPPPEDGNPREKLEYLFRLYDTDGNGVLDKNEINYVIARMMKMAEYFGWEDNELKSKLEDMMREIDYDGDGTVTLEEWLRGGLTTIPLLVLLGLDWSASDDGDHLWQIKAFKKPAYCNICVGLLFGFGRRGFRCVYCKYTVHQRCLQRCPNNCIETYSKARSPDLPMVHHWVEGNCSGKCFLCKSEVKSYRGLSGICCRWCQIVLHNRCVSDVSPVCTLGPNRVHIVPPTAIYPSVLDRRRKTVKEPEMSVQPIQPTYLHIEPEPGTTPLLVFINPKSGGLQGDEIKRKFQYSLNPKQVYDLVEDDPVQALQLFRNIRNLRVVGCGGDGTIGWILELIDKSNFATHPSVGVVPLGTGNDLARCLQWGSGYDGEPINALLRKIENASMVVLDRWDIEIIADAPTGSGPSWDNRTTSVVTNYFSVGVDAAICIKFHTEREKCPEKFNSRMKNKLLYFEFATSETFFASCRNLHLDVELECDGVPLDLAGGQPLQGIAILNIPSTHGGTNLWGDGSGIRGFFAEWKKTFDRLMGRRHNDESDPSSKINLDKTMQDFGDGLIEVVGLESCLHMGQVRTGLRASARRLAQCSTLTMRTKKRLPMQIDGEPWMQNPCTIKISHRCQVPMLRAPKSGGG